VNASRISSDYIIDRLQIRHAPQKRVSLTARVPIRDRAKVVGQGEGIVGEVQLQHVIARIGRIDPIQHRCKFGPNQRRRPEWIQHRVARQQMAGTENPQKVVAQHAPLF
jgi:hypothetical protein